MEIWLLFGDPRPRLRAWSARGASGSATYAAGTYVVRDRVRDRRIPPPAADAAGAGRLGRSADIARLPDGLAMAVRQFLGRAAGLSPASRAAIGAELHAEVLRHVAPPPPAGSHPELVLAAVLADRRRRDGARLAARRRSCGPGCCRPTPWRRRATPPLARAPVTGGPGPAGGHPVGLTTAAPRAPRRTPA